MRISVREALFKQVYLDFGGNIGVSGAVYAGTQTPLLVCGLVEEVNRLYAEKVRNDAKSAKPFIQGHRHKIFSAERIGEIKRLKMQGLSNRRIAKIFGCDEKTIRNYLKGGGDDDK